MNIGEFWGYLGSIDKIIAVEYFMDTLNLLFCNMAYSDFTIQKLLKKFGLSRSIIAFTTQIKSIEPSPNLIYMLSATNFAMLISEKAKSESIIYPILLDIYVRNNKNFGLFSGANLNVSPQESLLGECDFILSKEKNGFSSDSPIFGLVEAKKDDIDDYSMGQCAAQMYGALIANLRAETGIETIYGCVTTGEIWQFMKLENNTIWIDEKRYYINEVEKILGVLHWIVGQYIV